MSLILSGDAGVTFPNSTVQASAGSVLQVVSTQASTQTNTTSSSFSVTPLTIAITPKFSTSKIFVLATFPAQNVTAGTSSLFTLYRNSTNLSISGDTMGQLYASSTNGLYTTIAMSALDSPATTSSTTYAVYFKTTGNAQIFPNSFSGTITVMEIAG